MAKITMKTVQKATIEENFAQFLSATASRGVKDKTLETYKQHFHAISKRLDSSIPIADLTKHDLEDMILTMRKDHLSDSSINSYTRTLKVFLSWCNEEGDTDINIPLYKVAETVKEIYTNAGKGQNGKCFERQPAVNQINHQIVCKEDRRMKERGPHEGELFNTPNHADASCDKGQQQAGENAKSQFLDRNHFHCPGGMETTVDNDQNERAAAC